MNREEWIIRLSNVIYRTYDDKPKSHSKLRGLIRKIAKRYKLYDEVDKLERSFWYTPNG